MVGGRPNLFIVGAPKCGTTSLYRYLQGHPDVFMPVEKEPKYFGETWAELYRFCKTEEEYLKLFEAASGKRIVGEASTSYFSAPSAPRQIKDFAPEAKIIVMLREPLSFLTSWHHQRIYNHATTRTLAEELIWQQDHKSADTPDYMAVLNDWPAALSRWQEAFGTNVKLILFDDFANNTEAVFADVLRFLEIDASYRPEFKIHNPSKKPRNTLMSWFMASGFARGIKKQLIRLPWLYKLVAAITAPKSGRAKEMDKTVAGDLRKLIMPMLERLSAVSGSNLRHWY